MKQLDSLGGGVLGREDDYNPKDTDSGINKAGKPEGGGGERGGGGKTMIIVIFS